MENIYGFLMEIIQFSIQSCRFVVNIVWCNSNISCQSMDSTIENIYRESYEILTFDRGGFADLSNLNEVPVSSTSLIAEVEKDNIKEINQNENILYSSEYDFNIPSVSLESPLNIFYGCGSELTNSENRKRKASFDSIHSLDNTYEPVFVLLNNTNESNKKSKTNINEGEMVQSKYKCQNETSPSGSVIINTNYSLNILNECESSVSLNDPHESSIFLNDSQTIYRIENPIHETQKYVYKLHDEEDTGMMTQIDSTGNYQILIPEKQTVLSTNTELIETGTYGIEDHKNVKRSDTEPKTSYLHEDVAFIPCLGDENHIIFRNEDLISDKKFFLCYRRKDLERRTYVASNEVLENLYCPEVKISDDSKSGKNFEITLAIENIPRYLRTIFPKNFPMIKENVRYVSQKRVFMYKIYITFTFSRENKVKLIDLLPYLAYVNFQDMWKDYYVVTIFKWRYKITTACHSINLFQNEPNKHLNMPEKKQVSKQVRCFMGLKNSQFRHLIESTLIKTPNVKEILNKLSILHIHLLYINSLVYTPDQLKKIINEIRTVSKEFITGVIPIENASILNDTENEIVSVYTTIYSNFKSLSYSILNSYNLYG